MRLAALLLFLFTNAGNAAKSYDSFLVTIRDKKISVISPAKQSETVTIVVKNETFDKIISEIKAGAKTIARKPLDPSGSKGDTYTLTVKLSKGQKLYFVSVAPPFQEVPLFFSKENYEIP